MNELISVIIPIYNAEKYLNKCLESLIKQTYKNSFSALAINSFPFQRGDRRETG